MPIRSVPSRSPIVPVSLWRGWGGGGQAKEKREQELAMRVRDRRCEDERKALRKQMALEEDERQHIDDLKVRERGECSVVGLVELGYEEHLPFLCLCI